MSEDSVEVMFDYEYSLSDGKQISITKGDTFTLLAKSTDEWWKVIKDNKKIYVPANYVREVTSAKTSGHGHNVHQTELKSADHITIHSDIPSISMNGHRRTGSNASTGSDFCLDTHSCHSSLDSKGDSLTRSAPQPGHSAQNDERHVNASMANVSLHPTITVTQVRTTIHIPLKK